MTKATVNSLKFKVGDRAVYPAHGVGMIERIERKEVSGTIMTFYILRILDNDMMIMIPTNNVAGVGLRELITKDKVSKVYQVLKKKGPVIDTQTWNRRYREYMEKIKTGSVFEIAAVLRDLNLLKTTKTLSFGERRMLDTARTLLVKELALAKGVGEEKIEEELRAIFPAPPPPPPSPNE